MKVLFVRPKELFRELIGKFNWASRILPERDAANALLLKKKTVVTVMESKENAAERNVGDRK